MFIKDVNSQEGFIHVCENKSEKRMRQHKIEILKHDSSIHIIVWDEKENPMIQAIKWCPFCGCKLDQENDVQ